MADIESLLNRWQTAGVLDAEAARRIRAFEAGDARPAGLRWQGLVALILGALLLACGVVLFVSAHWDELGPGWRYALVIAMVAVFHIGGGMARASQRSLSTALHAVGTVATGTAIALVGQIFNIQEHWPAAILLWAVAALAGWILLQDEAQQTLTLLLFPAWMLSELCFYTEGHIGQDVYVGRFLLVWAMLYLTVFIGSKHRIAKGILFAVSAIGGVTGIVFLLANWTSYGDQPFIHLGVRVWAWIAIAALPLLFSLVRLLKCTIPVAAALIFSLALPWCSYRWTERYNYGNGVAGSYNHSDPNLLAHALCGAFALFIVWWGVRQASRSLVNLGVVYFAIAVGWFYFSNIFDKVGRSLGLIGLGVLFLAGGWALEKMRRRLTATIVAGRTVLEGK